MYYSSYRHDQVEEYRSAFEKDGFVVIEDVLSKDECNKSIDEVWNYLEKDGSVDRNDPNTWGDETWPKEICRNGGFMGKFPYWKRMKKLDDTFINKQPQAWRNRENPIVYEVFHQLLKTPKLWVSIDRYGVMRPTKGDQKLIEWQTKKDWLHWDLSPFHHGTSAAGFAPNPEIKCFDVENNYGSLRLQGLITLSDCPIQNGGFHCVPGFVNEKFFKWGYENKDTYGSLPDIKNRNFIEVPDDDPIRKHVIKVPMKPGSLLIWNSQLPHGNFPNDSAQFRMVQYIKMVPAASCHEFLPAMNHGRWESSYWFPNSYQPSELGEKLFGIKEWI